MKNLRTVILRSQAIEDFKANILPWTIHRYESDGIPDWIARCECWNDWTDILCKDSLISDWQYENWSQPDCCGD